VYKRQMLDGLKSRQQAGLVIFQKGGENICWMD